MVFVIFKTLCYFVPNSSTETLDTFHFYHAHMKNKVCNLCNLSSIRVMLNAQCNNCITKMFHTKKSTG